MFSQTIFFSFFFEKWKHILGYVQAYDKKVTLPDIEISLRND